MVRQCLAHKEEILTRKATLAKSWIQYGCNLPTEESFMPSASSPMWARIKNKFTAVAVMMPAMAAWLRRPDASRSKSSRVRI